MNSHTAYNTPPVTRESISALCRRFARRPEESVWFYRGTPESFAAAMKARGVAGLKVGAMDVRPLASLQVVEFDEWVLIGTPAGLRELTRERHDTVRCVLRQKEIAPELPAFVPRLLTLG